MLTLLRKHLEWRVNNDIKSDFEDHKDFAFSRWEFARPAEVDIDEIYDKSIYTNNNLFIAAPTYCKVFEWLATKKINHNITEEKLNVFIYKTLDLI